MKTYNYIVNNHIVINLNNRKCVNARLKTINTIKRNTLLNLVMVMLS